MPGKEELPILRLGAPVYCPLPRRQGIFSASQTSSLSSIHFSPAGVSCPGTPRLHLVLPSMAGTPSGPSQHVRVRRRRFCLLWSEEALLSTDTEQTHVLWMRSPPCSAALKGPGATANASDLGSVVETCTRSSEGNTAACVSVFTPDASPRADEVPLIKG